MVLRAVVPVVVLAAAGVACGARGPAPSTPADATWGTVPAVVADAPLVALTTCRRAGDDVRIDAVLTNDRAGPVLLQGVPVAVVDASGAVLVDEDDTSGLWSSVTIGPGRRALLTTTVDLGGAAPGAVTCALGTPDLRDAASPPTDDDVAIGTVSLTGCTDDHVVSFTNPSDRPVSTAITVEFFDDQGFSAGRLTLGQAPTTYTDGRPPGVGDVALAPRAEAAYPITILARVAEWGTPLAGPIAGCEVVAAGITTDPPVGEVIVD